MDLCPKQLSKRHWVIESSVSSSPCGPEREGHEAVVNLTAWCEAAWEMRGTGHDRGKRFWRDVLGLIQISLSNMDDAEVKAITCPSYQLLSPHVSTFARIPDFCIPSLLWVLLHAIAPNGAGVMPVLSLARWVECFRPWQYTRAFRVLANIRRACHTEH
ncbi:hypothetical protein Baya_11085 [Bagarius yarrelli]|uniref:Uncharacterized protein n=1 Tax=Bagarius yarrelli TaxID=175774 RepID=A0A556UZS3_BAGYA|nr:hypothetical protein Baya_11085 [Bagarius yarrelli]